MRYAKYARRVIPQARRSAYDRHVDLIAIPLAHPLATEEWETQRAGDALASLGIIDTESGAITLGMSSGGTKSNNKRQVVLL